MYVFSSLICANRSIFSLTHITCFLITDVSRCHRKRSFYLHSVYLHAIHENNRQLLKLNISYQISNKPRPDKMSGNINCAVQLIISSRITKLAAKRRMSFIYNSDNKNINNCVATRALIAVYFVQFRKRTQIALTINGKIIIGIIIPIITTNISNVINASVKQFYGGNWTVTT